MNDLNNMLSEARQAQNESSVAINEAKADVDATRDSLKKVSSDSTCKFRL